MTTAVPNSELIRTIGDNILRLRCALGISLERLAAAAGCHKNTIHNLETGKARAIQTDTLERIATALNASVYDLILPIADRDPAAIAESFEAYLSSQYAKDDGIRPEEIEALRAGPWPWGPLEPKGWSRILEGLRLAKRQ